MSAVQRVSIGQQAVGKWPSILAAMGVDRAFLTPKHGPCPFCLEPGKDRFRFDDKEGKGTFYCSQCGAGDGVEFVKRFLKIEFKEAAREIEKHLGAAKPIPIRRGRDEKTVRAEMNTIWLTGKPLAAVGATSRWWTARVGEVPSCSDLRGIEALQCPGESFFSAMVALIRGADGKPVNLHRTFLTRAGEKAAIDSPRRVMDMPMPKGCAVRLAPPSERLGVAEGLETAVAASILHGIPVWATLNAVNLENFIPPDSVREIVVFGDNDRSATGQHVSWGLVRRLRREKFSAHPKFPEVEGEDWNDVLMRQLGR